MAGANTNILTNDLYGGTDCTLCRLADDTQLERETDLWPVGFRMHNIVNKEVTLLCPKHALSERLFFSPENVFNLS